jgi:hypothetical protein
MDPASGILAIAAGWLVVRSSGDRSAEEVAEPERPDPDPASDDQAEPVQPTPSSPEWTTLLEELRGDIPLPFLLRWIARESGGNPCSVGSTSQLQRDGWAREAGIGQLYFESVNQRVYGVTVGELRGACDSGSQTATRELTDDEQRAQVASLVAMAGDYLRRGRALLARLGESWLEPDELCLAKLYHALPALPKSFLPAASNAGNATTWLAFREWVLALSPDEIDGIDHGARPYYPYLRLFQNAEYTGGIA